eukprot:SAG31_NODE_2220_length_6157_cov_4.078244_3_plen_151_part_00
MRVTVSSKIPPRVESDFTGVTPLGKMLSPLQLGLLLCLGSISATADVVTEVRALRDAGYITPQQFLAAKKESKMPGEWAAGNQQLLLRELREAGVISDEEMDAAIAQVSPEATRIETETAAHEDTPPPPPPPPFEHFSPHLNRQASDPAR